MTAAETTPGGAAPAGHNDSLTPVGTADVAPSAAAATDAVGFSGIAPYPSASAPAGVARVEDVEESMRDVVDPELGINVVDLGLVYGITVDDTTNIATIDMTLTSAACPLTDVIEDQIRTSLSGLVTDFRLNWVWMPPWGVDKITDEGREQLQALGFNV